MRRRKGGEWKRRGKEDRRREQKIDWEEEYWRKRVRKRIVKEDGKDWKRIIDWEEKRIGEEEERKNRKERRSEE